MAHTIKVKEFPKFELGKVPVVLEIHTEDGKNGTLSISKGGIKYIPSPKQKVSEIEKDWGQLHDILINNA